MEQILNSYNSKIDAKRRITLRKAQYEYYSVKEYKNGTIILEPRILVSPFDISENSLKMMDESMKNFKKGKVSKEIKED